MRGFLSNLLAVAVVLLITYSVCWGVGYALADVKRAKAELREAQINLGKAERLRDLAQKKALAESREETPDRRFITIFVNLGEDLDDLQACMELAWIVCENEGEVVCGMDIRGSCWFSCCPEDGS